MKKKRKSERVLRICNVLIFSFIRLSFMTYSMQICRKFVTRRKFSLFQLYTCVNDEILKFQYSSIQNLFYYFHINIQNIPNRGDGSVVEHLSRMREVGSLNPVCNRTESLNQEVPAPLPNAQLQI